MDGHGAEAGEVDGFRKPGVDNRIVTPDGPAEEIDDQGVVERQEHPAYEVLPRVLLIAGHFLVERRFSERRSLVEFELISCLETYLIKVCSR